MEREISVKENIKKKSIKGKQKGNAEERKIAKILSNWIFNDPNTLRRHPDSGATKYCYCGDIIPMKQIDIIWPFMIEVKTGYPKFLPTFYNYSKVQEWFLKAYYEGKQNNQNIVLLIMRFKNKKPLLATNHYIDKIVFNIIFPIFLEEDNCYLPIYVYNFEELIKQDAKEIFNFKAREGS